jgi:galacturan 1,4-alpha-galacturonidase
MPPLKITLVGGGSYGWTPNLLRNLFGMADLRGSEVMLYDLNPEALGLAFRLAERYREQYGGLTVRQTTDQTEALRDADFVTVTITTGGLRAMRPDLEIPARYGIWQAVGDTTGPGGLVRALRGVPVYLELGEAMARLCPKAWMLNCSNPLGALTRTAIRECGVKALGVCHGVRNRVRLLAEWCGAKPEEVDFLNSGVDHCAWFPKFEVNGRRLEEILLERGVLDWLKLPPDQAQADPRFGSLYHFRCGFLLWQHLGVLPAISDRHVIEFFPTFFRGDNVTKYGLELTTIADRERGAAEGKARVERLVSGEEPLPEPVGVEAMDNIAGWMVALSGGRPLEDNLNAPNTGQVPQLPAGALVETRGLLDGDGPHGVISPLPPPLEALIYPFCVREELIIDAALAGSFDQALAAMLLDPLVGDIAIAQPMLEEMLLATREWLPRFG